MTSRLLSLTGKSKVGAAGSGNEKRKGQQDEWVPGTAGNAVTTVEISISCRNLADKDLLSKSDPMCVLYNRPPGSKSWVQRMRTEVIENDLNPDFATKAVLEYRFEQVQMLRFEIYDIDNGAVKLTRQDTIGYVDVTLSQIVTAGMDGLTLELNNVSTSIINIYSEQTPGTIILVAEELAEEKDEVVLKLVGNNCGSWRGCLPPKNYFSMSKMNDAGRFLVVHRSNPARGVNPTWPPLKISSNALCSGDEDRELKIEIYQRRLSGTIEPVGSVLTTLNKMLRTSQEKVPLMSATGQSTNASIRIMSCSVQPINTLIDFIQSGTQIHCCFAIDFTCSNGDPSDNQSLHYVSNTGNQPNPYEQAIQAVGNVLKDYDNTSSFPSYGFGARIPPRGDIVHNFPLTLAKSPNCLSVPGVLEAYRSCISKIQLFGATNFAPVINTVAQIASKSKQGENYYILTIITDGVISDMVKTKKAIVDASALPISIIIIGVGEADFDAMEELDGDAVRISHKGKFAQRDIVQFVAYRSARSWMTNTGETTVDANELDRSNYIHSDEATTATAPGTTQQAETTGPPPPPAEGDSTSLKDGMAAHEDKHEKTNRLAQSQLAQEVLMEIPDQLTGYMKAKNILPTMIRASKQEASKPAPGTEGAEAPAAEAPTE